MLICNPVLLDIKALTVSKTSLPTMKWGEGKAYKCLSSSDFALIFKVLKAL